jgi:hypothetical protein
VTAQGADVLFATAGAKRDSLKILSIFTAQGHSVTVHDTGIDGDLLPASDYVGTYDLLVCDEVVGSATVGDRWRDSPVPVLCWEGFLYRDSRSSFVAPSGPGGTDPVGDAAYGQVTDETSINIILPDHPLAAGLPAGSVEVWDPSAPPDAIEGNGVITFSGGSTFIEGAVRVATVPGFDDRFCIFGVEAGTLDTNGTPVPARWVHLPWNNTIEARVMVEPSFFLLEAAIAWALELPEPTKIYNLTPASGAPFQPGTTALTFAVDKTTRSGSPVQQANIQLLVNGVDVTAGATVTDAGAQWSVSYAGFEANQTYSAIARATADDGGTSARATSFDTFDPGSLTVEAEDFNFGGGMFFDNPVLCNDAGGADNCYFGRVSTLEVDGVDFNGFADNANNIDNEYRLDDEIDTFKSGDFLRAKHADAPPGTSGPVLDYDMVTLGFTEWQNYTRTLPPGTYQIYLRAAAIFDEEIEIGFVTDPGATTQAIQRIGEFKVPGYMGYQTIPMTDVTTGAPKTFEADAGQPQTFRLTAALGDSGARLNYFFLQAVGDGPADPQPFAITSVTYLPGAPTKVALTWTSGDGERFTVEQSAALGLWAPTGGEIPSGGTSTTTEVTLPDPAPAEIYLRVRRVE